MDTRKALIESSRDVYLELGYTGFSMRKVAGRAGVSATAIYRHFDNKNDLLHEVVLAGFRLFGSYLIRAQRVPDPMQRLLTSSRLYLDFALENRAYFEIMFMATDALSGVGRLRPGEPADEIRQTFLLHLGYIEACEFETDDVLGVAVGGWAYGHGLLALYFANRMGMLREPFRPFFERTIDTYYRSLPRRLDG